MMIDNDARLYLWWDGVNDFDPTGSTVALQVTDTTGLEVDGSPFEMTWQDAAVHSGTRWTQTARTAVMFCGSAATATGSDVQLNAGTYRAQVLVTPTDGQIVPAQTQRLAIG